MRMQLTPILKTAVAEALAAASQDNAILDVYGIATRIQAAHPEENVAWEDIVQALLSGRSNLQAIEFAERFPEIVEIVLPGSVPDETAAPEESIPAS